MPSWKSATDWLLSDLNRVNSTVHRIVTLTQSAEIEEAKFPGTMIYQVCCTDPVYLIRYPDATATASDHIYLRTPDGLRK
jgi:hypothetical protein